MKRFLSLVLVFVLLTPAACAEIITLDPLPEYSKDLITGISGENSPEGQSPSIPPLYDGDFIMRNGIKFGMTTEEVKAIETSELLIDDTDMLGYNAKEIQGFDNTALRYDFNNSGKLYLVMYLFSEKHSDDNLYIEDFDSIDKSLSQKYGASVKDHETVWRSDTFKDEEKNFGFAISAGHAYIYSGWYLPKADVSIYHELSGDNYEFTHSIIYTNGTFLKDNKRDLGDI